MILKTSSNQPCGRDSEYITDAFLKSFSIHTISLDWVKENNNAYVLQRGSHNQLIGSLNGYLTIVVLAW